MLTRPIPRSREPKRLRSAPRARPSREVLESAPVFDRDYWLSHCEGYRVDGVEGRIGFVDAVRVLRGAAVLAVRAGRLGRRILLVPAEEVAFIVPRAERIWLQTAATIIDSEAAEA